MKKLIKIAVPAFILVSAAALGFIARNMKGGNEVLSDGTFTGTAEGRNAPIEMSVTVKDGKVAGASVVSEEETDFAKPAALKMAQEFAARGRTAGIDVVSGATITSKAALAALDAALNKAKGVQEKAVVLKDTECDVVVIGAGGAGLSAGTVTASAGKKTILLEKMGNVGGNTIAATGGLNASQTSVQEKLGISDTNDSYFEDTMKGGYNKNDPELVRNMVEKSAATVDWLISLGADLNDVGKMAGSSNKRTHRPKGGAAVGAHLVPVMKAAAENAGVDLRLSSKVVDVARGSDGYVVKVESKNGNYSVKAKAVVIAAGGFGANPDMVVEYKPELKGFGTTNHKGATGDAFAWIKNLGGVLVQMDEIQTHPTVIPGNGTMITEAVRGNGAVMVNRDGKRFCTEMATRDVMSKAILKQKGQTAFLVFDQDVRESLKAIEGYAKNGLLTQADSVEELASALGLPKDDFAAEMKGYAEIQKSGNDPLGRKANEMPRPLTKAPFYAVEVGPAIHHTMGGVKISTDAEVLDADGKPVPGLYAAGEVAGGVHGGNRLGGNAVADICIYGKIAGEKAVEFVNGK